MGNLFFFVMLILASNGAVVERHSSPPISKVSCEQLKAAVEVELKKPEYSAVKRLSVKCLPASEGRK